MIKITIAMTDEKCPSFIPRNVLTKLWYANDNVCPLHKQQQHKYQKDNWILDQTSGGHGQTHKPFISSS